MSEERFLSTQFCDDIRQEIGNKVSLMGCYGPSMLVGTLPAVLAKLCVQIRIYTPKHRPFTKLSVRLLREEEILGEVQFPNDALTAELPTGTYAALAKWRIATAVMVLSPFPIEKSCRLTVEADTEDGTLSGGSFWIEQAPPSN